MKYGVVPLALLAGCSFRPWTPSVSVAYWSEEVPAVREYTVPSSGSLAAAWQMPPDSPWARYQKSTLISAVDPMVGSAFLPDVTRLDIVGEAQAAASRVAKAGLPANTLWLLDLRGAASAAFASRLSREAREPIAPVVTFNNWPAEGSLVPADETLAGLVTFPPRLPDPAIVQSAHPVFLLDAWRLAFRFDAPTADVFDNRYMLQPSDFPDAQALHERGITSIVYVVEDLDDAEVEEDDLHATFRAWQAAGIKIFFVDLAFLQGAPPPANGVYPVDWAACLAPNTVWVDERYTLVDDPRFYARARGGFGLVYGRPVIAPGYRSSIGGYSSGGSGG